MNSLQQRDSRRLPLSFDVLEDRSTPALISISLVSIPVNFASVEPVISQRSVPVIVIETPVRAFSVAPSLQSVSLRETPLASIPQRTPVAGADVPAIIDGRNSPTASSAQNLGAQNQTSGTSAFAYSVPLNQNGNNFANTPVAFATDASRNNNLFSTPLADNFVRPTTQGVSADAIRDAFGPGALTDDLTQTGPNGQTPEQAPADGTNGSNNGQPSNRPAPSPAGEVRTPAEEEAARQGEALGSDAETAPEGVSVRALSIAIGSAALALGAGAYVVLRSSTADEKTPALAAQRPTETVVE